MNRLYCTCTFTRIIGQSLAILRYPCYPCYTQVQYLVVDLTGPLTAWACHRACAASLMVQNLDDSMPTYGALPVPTVNNKTENPDLKSQPEMRNENMMRMGLYTVTARDNTSTNLPLWA